MKISALILCSTVVVSLCSGNVVKSRSISPRSSRFTSIFAFGDSYTDNGSLQNFYNSKTDKIDRARYNVMVETQNQCI
ncbi:hypothetical protein BD408DRAFT_275968 [Parasitella parasitica]|nr:hypothetical protein BD408DRAFT_275968 [Parasitella parasitica]